MELSLQPQDIGAVTVAAVLPERQLLLLRGGDSQACSGHTSRGQEELPVEAAARLLRGLPVPWDPPNSFGFALLLGLQSWGR